MRRSRNNYLKIFAQCRRLIPRKNFQPHRPCSSRSGLQMKPWNYSFLTLKISTSRRVPWYEGAAPRFPSTNNGPESINAQIKRDGTLRQRLPLRDFFNCIFKIVKNWSVDRDPASPNFKAFAATPSLHTKILSESWIRQTERQDSPFKARGRKWDPLLHSIQNAEALVRQRHHDISPEKKQVRHTQEIEATPFHC